MEKEETTIYISYNNIPEGIDDDSSATIITIPKDKTQFNHWVEHVKSFRLKVIDEQEEAE